MRALLAGLLLLSAGVQAQDGSAALFAATLSDLHDEPLAMTELRGKPLVVNFWARWCGPCREEIPALVARAGGFARGGGEILGIAVEDDAAAVRDFAVAYEVNYRVLLAKDQGIGLLAANGNPNAGLPFTLVYDAAGRLVYRKLGIMSAGDMDAAFELALHPPGDPHAASR